MPNAANEAIGALSSDWRLVNWRSVIATSAKRPLASAFATLAATADLAATPTNPKLKEIQMSELERFIAASDARLKKKLALEIAQHPTDTEEDEFNKKSAEASMARSFAASVEPELLAILNPQYKGAESGIRGRIYFTVDGKRFYIICDPFRKNGDVQAGWLGVIVPGGNQQVAMLQFRDESFQDDLLQGIRRA
jgi:hypothetical protein